MEALNGWEGWWFVGFSLLRDGVAPPRISFDAPPHWNPRQAKAQIEALKAVDFQEVCREMERQQQRQLGRPLNEHERGLITVRADSGLRDLINNETTWLQQFRQTTQMLETKTERHQIWTELVRSRTVSAVKDACRQWENLPGIRGSGRLLYPGHVFANAQEFLRMKADRRFPRSTYADNSRLEYLARGMAGVMAKVSPFTAIRALRSLKHTSGGALWNEAEQQCRCWRCDNKRLKSALDSIRRELRK
jgi:hypothetical protein